MKAKLDTLRRLLKEATDLKVPWDYFHEHLAMHPELHRLGRRKTRSTLEAVLRAGVSKLYGREMVPTELLSIQLKKERFWHGLCNFGALEGIFFYFEGPDVGLLGLSRSLRDPRIDLFRFTALDVDPRSSFPSRDRGQA